MPVVVITGATAGAGRAIALRFAREGYDIALIAREESALEAARQECEQYGVRGISVSADVADAEAVINAANEIEYRLGGIDVWVNNAMAAVLSPFRQMTPEEFRRVTEVTYLGCVNGTRAALRLMEPRNRGHVIQVGSALAYRSIPLQSAYCGAKAAIRGFTDSVRTELMHAGRHISISMVQMPGMNTPQFSWARNKLDYAMQPVPPVYQPEVAADAVFRVVKHPVRELWVGKSTVQSIIGQFFFPGYLDRLMVKKAWEGQLNDTPIADARQDNLEQPIISFHDTHGEFSTGARKCAINMDSRFPGRALLGAAVATSLLALSLLTSRKN